MVRYSRGRCNGAGDVLCFGNSCCQALVRSLRCEVKLRKSRFDGKRSRNRLVKLVALQAVAAECVAPPSGGRAGVPERTAGYSGPVYCLLTITPWYFTFPSAAIRLATVRHQHERATGSRNPEAVLRLELKIDNKRIELKRKVA